MEGVRIKILGLATLTEGLCLCINTLILYFRGTLRLFSVKYLFREANIAQNFLLLEDG